MEFELWSDVSCAGAGPERLRLGVEACVIRVVMDVDLSIAQKIEEIYWTFLLLHVPEVGIDGCVLRRDRLYSGKIWAKLLLFELICLRPNCKLSFGPAEY